MEDLADALLGFSVVADRILSLELVVVKDSVAVFRR